TAGDSSIINAFNDLGTGSINLNQPQPTETIIHQEEEGESGPTLNLVDPYDEEKEEEEDATEFEDTSESEWMLDGVCISDLCLNFKKANLKLAKRTDLAQLSDICLLAL
ncbi:hypothetical protein K501DRAFT_162327, partial [Backusella circina FSU 941]